MEKKRLAFVDMAFHQKTRSGDFLREILGEKYEIYDYWYEEGKAQHKQLIKELLQFEEVFFFQVLLPYRQMVQLRKRNVRVVWAPMYDGLPMGNYYWKKVATLQLFVLSFSEAIDRKVKERGIMHCTVRYYQQPVKDMKNTKRGQEGLVVFFWYRGNIAFENWIRFFKHAAVKKIIYLSAPDPKYSKQIISEEIQRNYNIEIIETDFLNREEYLNYVKQCDVYVCPRKQEGIGMTLVEALSLGKFLLGYKDYTMKDYIIHGKNGFLFDNTTTEIIDYNLVNNSEESCSEIANSGYRKWVNDKERIVGLFGNIDQRLSTSLIVFFFYGFLEECKNTLRIFYKGK